MNSAIVAWSVLFALFGTTTGRLLLTYPSRLLQFARRVSSSECLPPLWVAGPKGSGHPCGLSLKFVNRLVDTPKCGDRDYSLRDIVLRSRSNTSQPPPGRETRQNN